jgi:hypothetical protein
VRPRGPGNEDATYSNLVPRLFPLVEEEPGNEVAPTRENFIDFRICHVIDLVEHRTLERQWQIRF